MMGSDFVWKDHCSSRMERRLEWQQQVKRYGSSRGER
jgi:hypothetical protein